MRERIACAAGFLIFAFFVGIAAGDEPQPEPTYIEIELVGEFGEEIIARGIDLALQASARQDVELAVVYLDSFGGDEDDARAVADVLASHRNAFELHIVVRRAIGEAMWVLLEADQLWVEQTSEIGPGVVADPQPIGFRGQVDTRQATSLAELTRRAAMRGFPREIILASAVPEESLWYTFNPDSGAARFSLEPVPGGTRLVGPSMVLAMTGRDMISFGLAREVPADGAADGEGRLPQLGRAVSGQRWLRQGASDIHRYTTRRDRMLERYETTAQLFARQESWVQSRAREAPRFSSRYQMPRGRTSSRQLRERRARIDEAIAAWQGVLRGLAELRILEGRLDRYWRDYQRAREQVHQTRMLQSRFVPDPPPPIDRSIDADQIERQARNEISRLRHERNQG